MKSFDESDYVRKYSLLYNLLLFDYAQLHLLLNHCLFGEAFDCVETTSRFLIFDQKNLPKLSFSQLLNHLKVIKSERTVFFCNAALRSPQQFIPTFDIIDDIVQLVVRQIANVSSLIFY